MVPTALKWSYGVKLMVTTHFDLISGPRVPKGAIWAQTLNFHGPIFWGILFVSNMACGVSRASQRNAWLIQHCYSSYGTTQLEKTGKKGSFGPERPFLGPWRSSEGPEWTDLVPTAPDWPAWVEFMVNTHFELVSGPFWA